jgi:lipooligosaccharide transport system permease protein
MTAPPGSREPTAAPPALPSWTRFVPGASAAPALRLVERNIVSWTGIWLVFVSVLLEPILFLFSIGIGVGEFVGDVTGPGGESVPYRTFVAGGLLAAAAMFGPLFDTTFNFFVKFKYFRLYDAVLATPMRPADVVRGEVGWSLLRSSVYSLAFLLTMLVLGLVESWWAILCLPVAVLIGFAFASAGLAASTFMRSWIDFDFVNLAVVPLFLLSATFFPLTEYPTAIQWLVRFTPLYQGVALERGLVLGHLEWTMLLNVAYLVVMGTVCLRIATGRVRRLLLP